MQQAPLQQKVAVWIAIVFGCLSKYAAISYHSANSSRREGSSATSAVAWRAAMRPLQFQDNCIFDV
jgi:hypothetical protein